MDYQKVFKANPKGYNQYTTGDKNVTREHENTPYALRSQGLAAAFAAYVQPTIEDELGGSVEDSVKS